MTKLYVFLNNVNHEDQFFVILYGIHLLSAVVTYLAIITSKVKRTLWLVSLTSTICPWVYAGVLLNNL